MKRTGFTMIELVFVIVILGILAAVAVPRLSQTKADASAAAAAQDWQTCLQGARMAYFEDNTTSDFTALPGCSGSTFSGVTLTSGTNNGVLN